MELILTLSKNSCSSCTQNAASFPEEQQDWNAQLCVCVGVYAGQQSTVWCSVRSACRVAVQTCQMQKRHSPFIMLASHESAVVPTQQVGGLLFEGVTLH